MDRAEKQDVTGLILAGGLSQRMGFNKAEAEMHGDSMLVRIIDKVKTVTSKIVVSSGSTFYPNILYPQIPDVTPQCGPMGGVFSVIKVTTSTHYLVVSCDIPLVSIKLLKYLLNQAINSNSTIAVPVDHNGSVQMVCAVYHRDILPILERQLKSHSFKMKNLLDLVPVKYIYIDREHPLYCEHAFINVNHPNTLEEARKLWNSQKRQ